MKNKKYLTLGPAIFLMLMFCLMLTGRGRAEMTGSTADGFAYSILGDSATITGYTGKDTTIVIPDVINGAAVTRIKRYAFDGRRDLREMTIPQSVTRIDGGAFFECDNLVVRGSMDAYVINDVESYYQDMEEFRRLGIRTQPKFLLQFRENGHLRHMLVQNFVRHTDEYPKALYDYFTFEKVFELYPADNNYDTDAMDKVKNLSRRLFQEGTMISHIVLVDLSEYKWFWAFNPDLSEGDYDDWRFFYETLFSSTQRFPRKQEEPQFRADSNIPNNRDAEPVPKEVVLISAGIESIPSEGNQPEAVYRTLWLFAEKKDGQFHDGALHQEDGFVLQELFTGTWLSNCQYPFWSRSHNVEFYDSLLPGYRLSKVARAINEPGPDLYNLTFSSPLPLSEESMAGAWRSREPFDDEAPYYLAGFINRAETIGDLRRIYESMPKEFWFIQPETDSLPTYADRIPNPREPSTHYVANAVQLADALEAAENGETIVLLGDIPIYYETFNVKNKKVKIRGLPGYQPSLHYARENVIADWAESNGFLFYVENASVEFENILMDMSGVMSCILLLGDSEVRLGAGTEITGFYNVMEASGNASIIVDGANIHHNSVVICAGGNFESMKIHIISGEIAYNSGYSSVINTGSGQISHRKQDCSFVMDGGSIHHNSSGYDGVINLKSVGKAEINGGEIFRNTGSSQITGAPICVYDSRLTITGGELFGNAGALAGCVFVGGTSTRSAKSKDSSLVMTGGSIHDNYSYDSKRSYGGIATDILIGDFIDKSSFEMKGGEIRKTPGRPEIPSILVQYKKNTCTISSGEIDITTIATQDGGKLVNRLKKR